MSRPHLCTCNSSTWHKVCYQERNGRSSRNLNETRSETLHAGCQKIPPEGSSPAFCGSYLDEWKELKELTVEPDSVVYQLECERLCSRDG